MNRTKKFLYNSSTNVIQQVVTMAAGFITPKIMLQFYGSEINGLVSSISQFIVYFNLVEAGLSSAAVYALYKPLADNDFDGVNSILSAAKKFYILSGYIFISLVVGLAVIYPTFVKPNELEPLMTGLLVLALGGAGALQFFVMSKYRVLLTADQKSYVISIATIASIIVNTTIIVILANCNVNIVILKTVALSSMFVRSFILHLYVKFRYTYVAYTVKPNFTALSKRWDALYQQMLGTIRTGSPVVIATIATDLITVSIYSIYYMVIGGINGVLSIFISGLYATFGDIIARDDKQLLQKTYKQFELAYFCILTVVYGTTMVMLMPFIRLYTKGVTDANYDIPLLGALFVLFGLFHNIKTPTGMLVISAGMYKETRKQVTIQILLLLFFSILLSFFLGLPGILIGMIISEIYRVIDLAVFIPRNVTKLPIRSSVFRMCRVLITFAFICMPFFYIELRPKNYIEWCLIAMAIVSILVVVVIISALIFDKDDLKFIYRRIRQNIKRSKT